MTLTIAPAAQSFSRWDELHALLMACFAYMADRIDPPSSMLRMSAADLEQKSRDEMLLLAMDGERIAGCAFVRLESAQDRNCAYIGKMAVDADYRGQGLARRFVEEAEALARRSGLAALELQTRIELTENRETFERLGFVVTRENAHEGYDRPTNITMRRELTPLSHSPSLPHRADTLS
ncbi:MAG: GNAT family N-acetyltransferase [Salaquimonas sp.]|jgi:GNAT superfamily N-acetyltransferase|nr:GNAT family N-acetyltransferase [Salaquimonas sp.]